MRSSFTEEERAEIRRLFTEANQAELIQLHRELIAKQAVALVRADADQSGFLEAMKSRIAALLVRTGRTVRPC